MNKKEFNFKDPGNAMKLAFYLNSNEVDKFADTGLTPLQSNK